MIYEIEREREKERKNNDKGFVTEFILFFGITINISVMSSNVMRTVFGKKSIFLGKYYLRERLA